VSFADGLHTDNKPIIKRSQLLRRMIFILLILYRSALAGFTAVNAADLFVSKFQKGKPAFL
jgi:hypothetical protein